MSAPPFRTDPDIEQVVVFPVLRGRARAPARALAGTLIAKHPGAFFYWSSLERVQSSQDIAGDLRHGMHRDTRVLREQGLIVDHTDAIVRDAIEDIPLEYAVIEKRYEHVGHDAINAALSQVCRGAPDRSALSFPPPRRRRHRRICRLPAATADQMDGQLA